MSSNKPGRPQKPLDPEAGPVQAFAHELRQLRKEADLTYRDLKAKTHYSFSSLQAATAGKAFPTWEVTEAFVRACHGDVEVWRRRYEATKAALHDSTKPSGTDDTVSATSADKTQTSDDSSDAPPPRIAVEQDTQPTDRTPVVSTSVSVSTTVAVSADAPTVSWHRRRITVLVAAGLPAVLLLMIAFSNPTNLETATGARSGVSIGPTTESVPPTTTPAPSSQPPGQSPAGSSRSSGQPARSSTRAPQSTQPPPANPQLPGGSGGPADLAHTAEDPNRYQGVQEKRVVELRKRTS